MHPSYNNYKNEYDIGMNEEHTRTDLLKSLLELSPEDFESFIAKVWEKRGWETAITSRNNDKGIDIVATKSGVYKEKALIQAKRYQPANKIGRPDIQQYDTLRRQEPDTDIVIIVTTSGFTQEALELANQLNLKTINGRSLINVIQSTLDTSEISSLLGIEMSERKEDTTNTEKDRSISTASPTKDLQPEDLSEKEEIIANIFREHSSKTTEKYSGQPSSALEFKFNSMINGLEIYQSYIGLHSIEFNDPDKENRAAEIVKNQGWRIERREESRLLNVSPSGSVDTDIHPEFEARFSRFIVETIFESSFENISEIEEYSFEQESDPIVETHQL